MLAYGNGTPSACANNLLKLARGEVPYERVKGLDPAIIGKPISAVRAEIEAGADFLIENYEPRVTFHGVNIQEPGETGGDLVIEAIITEKEG